jgi:hypothetical protein
VNPAISNQQSATPNAARHFRLSAFRREQGFTPEISEIAWRTRRRASAHYRRFVKAPHLQLPGNDKNSFAVNCGDLQRGLETGGKPK